MCEAEPIIPGMLADRFDIGVNGGPREPLVCLYDASSQIGSVSYMNRLGSSLEFL